MRMLLTYVLISFLGSNLTFAQQGVRFDTKASKTELGINERLRIDFEVNKDGDRFSPPSFDGFRVVSGPNQSISTSWINGKSSYRKTYTYFLSPTGQGTFTIGQATIEVDGDVYKTIPIKIKVTKSVEKPNNSDTPGDVSANDLQVVVEVSNANPYLNQAISLVYKIYFNSQLNVYDVPIKDLPEYRNFLTQNIDIGRLKVQRGYWKGKYYSYITIREVLLYPQKAGRIIIDPLSVDISMEIPNGRIDIFGRPIYQRTHKIIATKNKEIRVKSLPEKNKPDSFRGAVGQFRFSTRVNKTMLKATESLQATLKISGIGNLKLVKIPKLVMPSSIEVYEPESKESLTNSRTGTKGEITNNYTLIPQYKGQYKLPRIPFSYFDPSSNRYKTIYSDEVSFEVSQGPKLSSVKPPLSSSSTVGEVTKRPLPLSNTQFAFIKLQTKFVPIEKTPFISSIGFLWGLILPILIPLIVVLVYRNKKRAYADIENRRLRKADAMARKYLSEAKKQIGKEEQFYIALERALYNFLKAKLKIEIIDFSKDKISSLLAKRGVQDVHIDNFIGLISNCEQARYAPVNKSANQDDYQKSAKIISLIDKQL